jgi:hypothetical protein
MNRFDPLGVDAALDTARQRERKHPAFGIGSAQRFHKWLITPLARPSRCSSRPGLRLSAYWLIHPIA